MSTSYLNGQLLLAMPDLADFRFHHAVVALCAHNETGAFGVCLHHAIPELTVPFLMQQVDVEAADTPDVPVLSGGPVEANRGFVLHTPDYQGDDTFDTGDGFALTGTRDILEAIAAGKGPEHWVSILGYAGWGAGQLEEEIRANSWLAVPANDDILWKTAPEDRWNLGFSQQGIDLSMLSAGYGNA